MQPKTIALVVLLILSCCSTAAAQSKRRYRVAEVQDGATVSGRVAFSGTPPRIMLPVDKDEGTCCPKGEKEKPSPRLVVGKGKGVRNAVVFLSDVPRGKPFPKTQPVLDQKKCTFEPHIVLVPLRAKLQVRNSDPVLHNVHAFLGRSDVFNLAMPNKDQSIEKRLRRAGIIWVKCEVGHTWMSAYIFVMKHPYYAVTDTEGRFTLTDVPPGKKYTLRVWHEGWKILEKKSDGYYKYSREAQLDVPLALGKGERKELRFVLSEDGSIRQDRSPSDES